MMLARWLPSGAAAVLLPMLLVLDSVTSCSALFMNMNMNVTASAEAAMQRFLHNDGNNPVPKEGETVTPLTFNQKLLICNAYPSSSPMTINKNGLEALADDKAPVAYRDCRYFGAHVQPKDRLQFKLRDFDVEGSFVVGGLPASDAILLLVLDKNGKGKSTMVNFQSYAFPTSGETKEAQLAVIDAFRGNSSAPMLKMEDHVETKQQNTVSKRIEELSFNRVYAIEEGIYDASVENSLQGAEPKDQVLSSLESAMHTVKLKAHENYVILRTGEEEFGDGPSLVVFPAAEFRSAGFRSARIAWSGMVALAAAFLVAQF